MAVRAGQLIAEGCSPASVLAFASTDSPMVALERLSSAGNLSAPVMDDSSTCLGLVDKFDIICFALSRLDPEEGLLFQLQSLASRAGALSTSKVCDIMNASGKNLYLPVSREATLSEIVRTLSGSTPRVPVLDAGGAIVGMISQSAVAKFLVSHPEMCAEDSAATLGDTVLRIKARAQHKSVLSVRSSSDALGALRVMRAHRVAGLAVVDDAGTLVGAMSVTDLKNVRLLKNLLDPVLSVAPRTPVTCVASDTLLDVARKFATNRAHRMFMVDADRRPVAVISLTDLMQAIVA
jgi:CBS-domain-containing membrane protein